MLPNVALGPSRRKRESNQRAWTGVTSSRQRRRWVAGNANWYNAKWQNVSWRTGTKGKLKARFAAVRVRIADEPPQRIRDKGQQHLPGDEAWLIGEHRMSGEEILSRQSARWDCATHLGCHHQGAMDLRASPSAAERRTRPRPLRGAVLARPSSSCAHDDDCLRLPPASPP